MPAHAKYPAPHSQLSALAVDAKRRGMSFEEFWEEAARPRRCRACELSTLLPECPECGARTVGPTPVTVSDPDPPVRAVLWPTDSVDRRTWLGAVDESREGWQRAYEGLEAPRRELALRRLSPTLDAIAAAAADEAVDELNGAAA